MKKIFLFLSTLLVMRTVYVHAADIEGTSVLLRGVDKVTGRMSLLETELDTPAFFGNLRVTAHKCLKKPPEEMPENTAFLTVEERNKDEAYNVVFNGWMFSSNPALSAMEHPIYDIWVLECLSDEPSLKEWEKMVPVSIPVMQGKRINVEQLGDLEPSAEEEIIPKL